MNHKTNPIIANDILRYKKNSLASGLALAGLASGCLYFLILYAPINKNSYYYTWMIAFDVVYNLFFLLFTLIPMFNTSLELARKLIHIEFLNNRYKC